MAHIEILADGQVINTIIADEEFAEANYPGQWQLAAVQPTVEPPSPVAYKVLSKLGFRNRFTAMEKAAIEFAAIDDPTKTQDQRFQSAMLRANLADQRDAKYIDVRSDTVAGQQTRAGLQMLESAGLLAEGRVAEIVDAPITDAEAYKEAL